MKLIKLTDDHYVVVDDTEIKEGDFVINIQRNHIYPTPVQVIDVEYINRRNDVFKKITHLTQPLEYDEDNTYTYGKVKYVPLSYIKELIGEVDLKKVAEERFWKWNGRDWEEHEVTQIEKGQYVSGFVSGYNQALEDNKEKKYTKEDLKYLLNLLTYDDLSEDEKIESCIEYIRDLLQTKTEWEVEWEICETYKLDECNSRFACCNKPKKLKLK